eukprot:11355447-Alexandrium_andersonii.AAC.1
MSASLVGSEMCIRDRTFLDAAPRAPSVTPDFMKRWHATEQAVQANGKTFWQLIQPSLLVASAVQADKVAEVQVGILAEKVVAILKDQQSDADVVVALGGWLQALSSNLRDGLPDTASAQLDSLEVL